MIEFKVAGPFEVPVAKHEKSGVKLIEKDFLKPFWDEISLGEDVGVYIFAKKAAKGFVPLYVGKTEKSFRAEAFNSRNMLMLNEFFHNGDKGTLVLFLICHPLDKNICSISIDELETTAIQYGLKANPSLLNSKKRKPTDTWGIYGVLRCGRATNPARDLKRCLNID